LLLKGLSVEVEVIVQPGEMNACNLYVSFTRGAKKVAVLLSFLILDWALNIVEPYTQPR
jgi:hypothetical protein